MEDQIEADLEIAMAKGLDVGPSDHAELRQTFKDFRDRPGLFLPPDKVMEARELEAQARSPRNQRRNKQGEEKIFCLKFIQQLLECVFSFYCYYCYSVTLIIDLNSKNL